MQHPFEGVLQPAEKPAARPVPGSSRRSFLSRLALGVGALLGLKASAQAQSPSWYWPPRPPQPPLPTPPWSGPIITQAWGETGGGYTFAWGEQGGYWPPRYGYGYGWRPPGWNWGPGYTTQALGEEGGGGYTTYALGEEG